MTYFEKMESSKTITNNSKDYVPGDIFCWDLGHGIKHIGIVLNQKSADQKRHLIIHNIVQGQVVADSLFNYKKIEHYRYR